MKNVFKSIFSKKISRIWFIVTATLLALLIVINALACTSFYTVLASVLGGRRAVYADGTEGVYMSDYESKAATLDAANRFNRTIEEEGAVLLMNKNDALPVRTPESDENRAPGPPQGQRFRQEFSKPCLWRHGLGRGNDFAAGRQGGSVCRARGRRL